MAEQRAIYPWDPGYHEERIREQRSRDRFHSEDAEIDINQNNQALISNSLRSSAAPDPSMGFGFGSRSPPPPFSPNRLSARLETLARDRGRLPDQEMGVYAFADDPIKEESQNQAMSPDSSPRSAGLQHTCGDSSIQSSTTSYEPQSSSPAVEAHLPSCSHRKEKHMTYPIGILKKPSKDFNLATKGSKTSTSTVLEKDIHLGIALVIGGCGFLGHHIVRLLLAEPTCTAVHVMSREPFKNRFPNVTYHIGDITEFAHIDHVVSQVRPTIVFNTASPQLYGNHDYAGDYFTVNVDGNKNLLNAMEDVGTVKAFVYTSSAPIVATPGASYDQAEEDQDTLAVPVLRKGDPYHVAKALGDKLVLEANDKFGFKTACIRPAALYGEGDSQMVAPVIRFLKYPNIKIWMGNNDIFMDFAYVGHVAEAEILCAKGLLRNIVDPFAPIVEGEAFNVTDNDPQQPANFFRKYWALVGNTTPVTRIWYLHPKLLIWMAHVTDWCIWALTAGRPFQLMPERMEFMVYNRTHSIEKIREVLRFEPWVNQPHENQAEAVKGALDWYLLPKNHGPLPLPVVSAWPEIPFKLITDTGYKAIPDLAQDHFCIHNARIMAVMYNTFFRALNAIYHQAPLVKAGTQEAVDFLAYCRMTYGIIHDRQLTEKNVYFLEIERVAQIPGLTSKNVEQHEKMGTRLEGFGKYSEATSAQQYDGEKIRALIDEFAVAFQRHSHVQINAIIGLHDKIDSSALGKIYAATGATDIWNTDHSEVTPFILGCQDKTFPVDEAIFQMPLISYVLVFAIRTFLAPRHARLWRFNPSDLDGIPRAPPKKIAATDVALPRAVSSGWFEAILCILILASLVFTASLELDGK